MPEETASLVRRVCSFLARGTAYHLAYAGWRLRRRLGRRTGPWGRWPTLEELGLDGPEALAQLRARYLDPGRAALLCRWEQRDEICAKVPPADRERTLREAEDVLARKFVHRGAEVRFGGEIDWLAAPGGNLDWAWELNRHHFFVTLGRAYWYTGEERFAEGFVALLREWMARHPPSVDGPAWRSVFEVGVRVSNWCWAQALFLPSRALDDQAHGDLVRGLQAMGRFLLRFAERHAWNNHLLLEARALAMLGLLHPELPGAARWRDEGLKLYDREVARQVLSDGVHSERASLYHAIILSDLLEHMVVLKASGLGEGHRRYASAIITAAAMALFLGAITREGGSFPMLGDSSAADRHVRFPPLAGTRWIVGAPGIPASGRVDEALVWLLAAHGKLHALEGPPAPALVRAATSRAFPAGGYYVLAGSWGGGARPREAHLVFDCGPFGDPIVPGHGHADALSVDFAIGGEPILVDPGVYSTHLGLAWRGFFRGTTAHNTVVVDGRDQSILMGGRKVYRPARARLRSWLTGGVFDLAIGSHDGYGRLRDPVAHTRAVLLLKTGRLLVLDDLQGKGDHDVDVLFHLPPRARVELSGEGSAGRPAWARVESPGGVRLALAPLGGMGAAGIPGGAEASSLPLEARVIEGLEPHGEDRPQGWVAYRSGEKQAAPVVSFFARCRLPIALPTALISLDGAEAAGAAFPFEVESFSGSGAPAGAGVNAGADPATQTETARVWRLRLPHGGTELLVWRPPGTPRPVQGGSTWAAGGHSGDGDLVSIERSARGEVLGVVVWNGTFLEQAGELIARLEGAASPSSFGFSMRGAHLEAQFSGAAGGAPRLRLGAWARAAQSVTVNEAESFLRLDGKGAYLDLRRQ